MCCLEKQTLKARYNLVSITIADAIVSVDALSEHTP